MLEGKLRAALQSGQRLIGVIPAQASADLVETCGLLGFDFVFIDGEHGVLNLETCRDMIRAADAVGLPVLTRVPKNDPAVMLPYLEAGSAGVIVPHVNSPQDARRAVEAVKFWPQGSRGAGSGSRANGYGLRRSATEYFNVANEQTLVIPMVEEPEAIDAIAQIGGVEGIDLVFIGPADLALSLGHPGESNHPEVRAAIGRGFLAARAAGVRVGTVAYSAELASSALQLGAQLIVHSTNLLLAASANEYLTSTRALA